MKAALAKGDTPREKVVAAIVALIDRCQFRIGTEKYAEEHGTFGVTTLRPEHVTVSGSEVRFQFTGKKQVPWDKSVTDAELAEFIGHLATDGPGDRLFWYHRDGKQYPIKASHVNDFLGKYGITAKDLRTYHATKAMFTELKTASRPPRSKPLPKKEIAARLKAAFDTVAHQMGHTPAVCKTSYVLPQLVEDFERNGGRLSLSAWEDAAR
jgi:DNA topoisomerase I